MLVLTRKVGESLLIGEDIEITVTEISGDKVRIGIQAPAQLRILRRELRDTMAANEEARASVRSISPQDLVKRLRDLGPLT